jgi:hypothetical protein
VTATSHPASRSARLALALAVTLAAACSPDGPDGHDERPFRGLRGKAAGAATVLAVVVDGRDAAPWTADDFAKVEGWSVRGDSGAARAVWSLPDLAAALVGPRARVVRMQGRDGALEVSADAWRSADAIPAFRRTGRGELKFQWVRPDGRPRHDRGELPGVTRLELVVD